MSRTKKPTEVVEVDADFGFLTEFQEADTSTEALDQYRIVPRLKIVQSMSSSELKDSHGEGAMIISPGGILVAEKRDPFLFVPLLFFAEFCKWSDREETNATPILERSFDPTSEIARKARDPELRTEVYGEKDQFEYRYVEHMNFLGVVYGDGSLDPIVLGFSRGDFGTGRIFASSIKMRRVNGRAAPLWSQVWEFHTDTRKGPKGEWWTLKFEAAQIPYIKEAEASSFRELHERLKAELAESKLVVDREAETVDTEKEAF